jgi:hypothetical protein
VKQEPLGIRSRNPGNLRPTFRNGEHVPWQGELPPNGSGYCVFDTPENGIRALAKNLLAYQRKHRIRTVERIIARWAPGTENDTEAYIRHVVQLTGYRRDEELDVGNPAVLDALVTAIIRHENGPPPGRSWYTDEQVSVGIVRALA